MNRINRLLRVLPLAAFALLVGNSECLAQQSEITAVRAAIDAYHAAIGARDLAKLEPLWAHDENVMVVNPADKKIAAGWDAVKKDFEAGFKANPAKFEILQADGPHIVVDGKVAWSIGQVHNNTNLAQGVFETDVFENRGGRWLLVSHTALRVPQ